MKINPLRNQSLQLVADIARGIDRQLLDKYKIERKLRRLQEKAAEYDAELAEGIGATITMLDDMCSLSLSEEQLADYASVSKEEQAEIEERRRGMY